MSAAGPTVEWIFEDLVEAYIERFSIAVEGGETEMMAHDVATQEVIRLSNGTGFRAGDVATAARGRLRR